MGHTSDWIYKPVIMQSLYRAGLQTLRRFGVLHRAEYNFSVQVIIDSLHKYIESGEEAFKDETNTD